MELGVITAFVIGTLVLLIPVAFIWYVCIGGIYVAIKNGKIYFLEVKTKTGRASKEQLNFIEQMKKNGCVAGIVRSVEDAKKLCLT